MRNVSAKDAFSGNDCQQRFHVILGNLREENPREIFRADESAF
jgi:hypothetical protein